MIPYEKIRRFAVVMKRSDTEKMYEVRLNW